MDLELVTPAEAYLPSYIDALRRRWSPNTVRPEVADEELAEIERDAAAFLARKTDLDAAAPPIRVADGTTRPRLPGFSKWLWDGEMCGAINFRFQPGTTDLPSHVLGHIGYAVVPWKRRRGHATTALRLLLPELSRFGLAHVELTTDVDNVASQRVIVANGGVEQERFIAAEANGGLPMIRYRIVLDR